MDRGISGIGTITLDNDRTILMPCTLVDEECELWIHFLDQTHVLMLGWDRVEVSWTEFNDSKNAVLCTVYDRFGYIPPIKVFMSGLNYHSLTEFCNDVWEPSEGLQLSDTTEPMDMDSDDTTEPMDTENESETVDEPVPKRGWFSWIW